MSACPLGGMEQATALIVRAQYHVATVCVMAEPDYQKLMRIRRGHAHTHRAGTWGLDNDRPLICIRHESMYDRECECGYGWLVWHELAHALVDLDGVREKDMHGPAWAAHRLALRHRAEIDVSRHGHTVDWTTVLV